MNAKPQGHSQLESLKAFLEDYMVLLTTSVYVSSVHAIRSLSRVTECAS